MSGETETHLESEGVTILTPDEQASVELVCEQHEWARDLTPAQWRALLDVRADLARRREKAALRVERYDLDGDIVLTPEQEALAAIYREQDRQRADAWTWIGAKFDPDRSPAELKRMIVADLAQAIRDGQIPQDRYCIGISRDAINVTSTAYRAFMKSGGERPVDWKLCAKIADILRPYNRGYAGSDASDYQYRIRFNGDLAV